MSKITQALEKAARERRLRSQEQPTTTADAVTVPFSSVQRLGQVAPAGRLQVDPHIVSLTDPQSPIAEQYRILQTKLQALRLRPGPKVLVVTSAVNGEGKSVTSLNLALTCARQERLRVVLVDGDMRRGSIRRWLGMEEGPGLSHSLLNGGELNGSLVKLQDPVLTILPSGAVPFQPAELLASTGMHRLLATLRQQFDLVIIDAPPVLPVADAGIMAAQADGVLLVVRAGKTQRRAVLHAQNILKQMKTNVLGSVLTHVEHHVPGYARYYQYYRQQAQDRAEAGTTNGSTDAQSVPMTEGGANG